MLSKTKRMLDKKFAAREKALKLQREALPICQAGVRNIHKDNFTAAEQKIAKLRGMIKQMEHVLKDYPDIIDPVVGIVYQEYAELVIYLTFIKNHQLPELDIPEKYFITGIGDAIGELKRRVMEYLAKHELQKVEELENELEELYYQFASLQYPSALVPNLKKKQDIARKVLNELHAQILSYKLQIK